MLCENVPNFSGNHPCPAAATQPSESRLGKHLGFFLYRRLCDSFQPTPTPSVFFLPDSSQHPTSPFPDRSAMSWISWTSLVPTLLILSASLAWWLTELSNSRVNLFAAIGLALCCWAVAPELSRNVTYSVYAWTVDALATLHLELLILRHAKMLLTGGAVVWYVGVLLPRRRRRRCTVLPVHAAMRRPRFRSMLIHT